MKSAIYVSGLIAMLIFGTAAYGQQKPEQFYRVQIISVPTVTLTTQQFLTGDANGKPATLAGELRLPGPAAQQTGKLPAVILVPGLGSADSSHERWARELGSIGVATFILDSFAGGGLLNMNDHTVSG